MNGYAMMTRGEEHEAVKTWATARQSMAAAEIGKAAMMESVDGYAAVAGGSACVDEAEIAGGEVARTMTAKSSSQAIAVHSSHSRMPCFLDPERRTTAVREQRCLCWMTAQVGEEAVAQRQVAAVVVLPVPFHRFHHDPHLQLISEECQKELQEMEKGVLKQVVKAEASAVVEMAACWGV